MKPRKRDGDYGMMHRILKILAWRYATPSELSSILGISRQAVHYHLSRLKDWGFVVESTRECVLAVCFNEAWTDCILEENGMIKPVSCDKLGSGGYYVYASVFYIRKMFPSRPAPALWSPPTTFMNLVRERLEKIGVLGETKGYDIILMAGVLHLMTAVLWNPKPRGDNYWVRLRHLTTRGIHMKLPDYIRWYMHMKAVTKVKRQKPDIISEPIQNIKEYKEYKEQLRFEYLAEYEQKYTPSLRKLRWILAKMYDYLMVERLGGGHCPYGVWVPHPSLFTQDNKPDFHLPQHRHVTAKHTYRPMSIKQSLTQGRYPDNQIKNKGP